MSDLLRTAILGTAQASGAAESGTDADPLVAKLELGAAIERERALLLRAGAAAMLRRAGTRPKPWAEPGVAAENESLERASPSLAGLLAGLLEGNSNDLLAEALERMASARLRVPEELLPLALGEYAPEVRALLLPVLGERGRWLADQSSAWPADPTRDDWSWARTAASSSLDVRLPPDADRGWEEGSSNEREQLLELALHVDRARALTWIASTLQSDKPEQRRRWIELVGASATRDDAGLLEAATNDRSAMVRLAAARASWRVPDGKLAQALRARLEALFGPPESLRVELPPEPFDKALEKLGIVETPPEGVGRRQWWLAQLMSAVTPEFFRERWARSPAALIELSSQHELGFVLLDGWTSAALRFGATAWLAPLWDAWYELDDPSGWTEASPLVSLTERLVADGLRSELEPRLIRCVRTSRHAELLGALPRPWAENVSDAFIAALSARPAWLPSVWADAATCVAMGRVPSTLETPAVTGKKQPFDDALGKFMSVIELRRQIARTIAAQETR